LLDHRRVAVRVLQDSAKPNILGARYVDPQGGGDGLKAPRALTPLPDLGLHRGGEPVILDPFDDAGDTIGPSAFAVMEILQRENEERARSVS
jgi:hypothetical protein